MEGKKPMSKRGQNEGSIFEENPGRWVALLTLGYEVKDGKRRRIRKKFVSPTRAAVQKKLTAALKEQQTGGIVPIEKDTLGQYLDVWLKSLAMRGRSEKTVTSYTWLAEKHIIPELGRIPLTRLTQVHLNDYMAKKIESGLSARTVRYCHAVIRSSLTRAAKDGLVARNVAMLADPPAQSTKHKVEPLTIDEARRFLAAVEGHRLEALYSVAIAAGLRRGEAFGLELTGIDLERGVLQVTQTYQPIKKKGMVARRAGKTDKSLRMIPLPSFAIAVLKRHLERRAQERAFAGESWKERGLVFTSTIGTPLQPSNVLRHFHGVLDALKIDRRRFHDLRHTAASLLLAQGATLHEVKEILGHSQIALTADLYGHAYTSVLKTTMDRVGSLLAPRAPQNPVAPQLATLAVQGKPN